MLNVTTDNTDSNANSNQTVTQALPQPCIVLFGDSDADFWNIHQKRSHGPARQMPILNVGVGGTEMQQMSMYTDPTQMAGFCFEGNKFYQPVAVYVCVGGENDFVSGAGVDEIFGHFKSLVRGILETHRMTARNNPFYALKPRNDKTVDS